MTALQVSDFKSRQRETWAAGDFDRIAELLWPVGARLVSRVGVGAGEEVLDIGCGTGNAAIPAAAAGARAVGLDLTPELFDAGRVRARAAGVEVEWVEGDAEALPYGDERFDVVLSTFGVMFAPRHQVAVDELVRVLRPGGRIGLCSWTPGGAVGEFFATLAGYLPPPPEFAAPPPLWGDEQHVRALFANTDVELHLEHDEIVYELRSPEHLIELLETWFGPLVKARQALEPMGHWHNLRADFASQLERDNRSSAGGFTQANEYLIVEGRKLG